MLLVGCTQPTQELPTQLNRYENSTIEAGFDTIITMIAFSENKATFDYYFNIMKDEFWYLNKLYDKYNSYPGVNNIYTINSQAGKAPVKVDPLIIQLIDISYYWYQQGDGLFDITLGSLLKVWHEYREEGLALNKKGLGGNIPTIEELEEANQFTGWEFIEIDRENNTVYLTDARASLDVGAIAKGFAAEIVALKLEEMGLKHALISAGGNVRSINTRANGDPWAVGIESPNMGRSRSLDTIRIPFNISIVTSGDYQRYYQGVDGKYYHHLINPNTLFPETTFRSVTMITSDSAIADALSTILFLMDFNQGYQFVQDLQRDNPDEIIGAFWVFEQADPSLPTKPSEGLHVFASESIRPYSRIYNP